MNQINQSIVNGTPKKRDVLIIIKYLYCLISLRINHFMVDAHPIRQSISCRGLHAVTWTSVRGLEGCWVKFLHAAFVFGKHFDIIKIQRVVVGNCLLIYWSLCIFCIWNLLSFLNNFCRVDWQDGALSLAEYILSWALHIGSIFNCWDWMSL